MTRSTPTTLSPQPIFFPDLPLSSRAMRKIFTLVVPAVTVVVRVGVRKEAGVAVGDGVTDAMGVSVAGAGVMMRVGVGRTSGLQPRRTMPGATASRFKKRDCADCISTYDALE